MNPILNKYIPLSAPQQVANNEFRMLTAESEFIIQRVQSIIGLQMLCSCLGNDFVRK